MKLTIRGEGADPSEKYPDIKYTIIAESVDYKTTIVVWGDKGMWKLFASQLPDFPFNNTQDVTFKAIGLSIAIHLVDTAGRTELRISTDEGFNQIRFSDYIEAGALDELSEKLMHADFLTTAELIWASNI